MSSPEKGRPAIIGIQPTKGGTFQPVPPYSGPPRNMPDESLNHDNYGKGFAPMKGGDIFEPVPPYSGPRRSAPDESIRGHTQGPQPAVTAWWNKSPEQRAKEKASFILYDTNKYPSRDRFGDRAVPLKRNTVYAAKGFHGIIKYPTNFVVGERGKERVSISRVKKSHKKLHHERKNKNYLNINLSEFVEDFKW